MRHIISTFSFILLIVSLVAARAVPGERDIFARAPYPAPTPAIFPRQPHKGKGDNHDNDTGKGRGGNGHYTTRKATPTGHVPYPTGTFNGTYCGTATGSTGYYPHPTGFVGYGKGKGRGSDNGQ